MNKKNKYHFIGIGGVSMSALALFLKEKGFFVSGSDIVKNERTQQLLRAGIEVDFGHVIGGIKNADIIVKSGAIFENDKEIEYAKAHRKKIVTRAKLLGAIAKMHKHVISIAGSHGKTTTTAMIAEIFVMAGLNPTIHIGGVSKNLKEFPPTGGKDFFITEACEFKNSFLSLKSEVGVVLNIEKDHMDFFKTEKNLLKSFKKFAQKSKKIVTNAPIKKNNITFGFENEFCVAKNLEMNNFGGYDFDAKFGMEEIGRISLKIPFLHNAKNALAAICVAKYYSIENKTIIDALNSFAGTKRRCEKIGDIGGVPIIIDYAHHPSEIANTLKGLKEMYAGKVLCIFQPHTYSRTKLLLEEFMQCFKCSDMLVVFKTFSAREKF
ncbi:MAG: UDP-N-acetylmuramate--L-alanine ligase, partial [Clostridia bacterium]